VQTVTPRQIGKTAAKLLHERLTETGIVRGLYSRIMVTMPAVVQETAVDDTGSRLAPMFQATAEQYAMCFGYARLSIRASTLFKKRLLGLFSVADKRAWGGLHGGCT
jgi:hypothetical protein